MKIKKGDIILIIIALTVGVAAILFLNLMPKTEGGYVKIYIDTQEFASLPLNIDDTLVVEYSGNKNIVTIKDGAASMTYADCPDLICTKHKPIRYTNETIVCLPHKVVLEVAGGEEGEIDVYAYTNIK